MDFRVQRLHAAVHHLGEAGEIGNVADLQAGVLERLRRAAGGDEISAEGGEFPRTLDEARLVGDGDQNSLYRHAVGYVFRGGFGRGHGDSSTGWRPIASRWLS